jgi:hypothetical protein
MARNQHCVKLPTPPLLENQSLRGIAVSKIEVEMKNLSQDTAEGCVHSLTHTVELELRGLSKKDSRIQNRTEPRRRVFLRW